MSRLRMIACCVVFYAAVAFLTLLVLWAVCCVAAGVGEFMRTGGQEPVGW